MTDLRLSFRQLTKAPTFTAVVIEMLAALLIPARAESPATPVPAGGTIEITYVANEGFLISSADRKVLIDGIFTEGWGQFYTPTVETLDKARNALPPFDHLDALLVSHDHLDHINPAAVVQHLSGDRKAILIGTPQVAGLLKPLAGYEVVAKQIVVVAPGPGVATGTLIPGIKVRSVALQHLDDSEGRIQNLGFLVNVGGFTLFHVGDAGLSEGPVYRNLKLAGEKIDLAFLNRCWFDNENIAHAREIIADLKPNAIILMHMDVGQETHYRDLIGKMEGLPPVYLPAAPMDTLRFRLVDGTLAADRLPLQRQADTFPAPPPPGAALDYLGQPPPGNMAIVFARGVISTDQLAHSAPAFSPDGDEVFWSLARRNKEDGEPQVIMTMRREAGKWSAPVVASFSGKYFDDGPIFSADGRRIYFSSTRPTPAGTTNDDIWFVERRDQGWGEPRCLGFVARFPELKAVCQPSITRNGTLDFISRPKNTPLAGTLEGPPSAFLIHRAELINGEYPKPELLPQSINAPDAYVNWKPFIAPDKSFLLFSSGRCDRHGGGDLYRSLRAPDGSWTQPEILPESINTPKQERFPLISPDGQYLFFTRGDRSHDVYWVSMAAIPTLRRMTAPSPENPR